MVINMCNQELPLETTHTSGIKGDLQNRSKLDLFYGGQWPLKTRRCTEDSGWMT